MNTEQGPTTTLAATPVAGRADEWVTPTEAARRTGLFESGSAMLAAAASDEVPRSSAARGLVNLRPFVAAPPTPEADMLLFTVAVLGRGRTTAA